MEKDVKVRRQKKEIFLKKNINLIMKELESLKIAVVLQKKDKMDHQSLQPLSIAAQHRIKKVYKIK